MSVHLLKPSEIKSLLALVEKMNYTFKTFIGDGNFSKTLLLEDCDNEHQVVGKVVERYNMGEFQIWPRLRHENLNPLLDMMANDDGTTLFICPLVGKSLRDVIEDSGFGQHPKCFERKRRYARDILSGLEYLHQNSVCLMNLTDNSILINSSSDKAIISDFSRAVNVSSEDQVILFECECEGIPLPPEATENNVVHPKPFDMWTCGFMFLQMFTKHVLPWCSLGTDLLDGLDIELLRRTNKSSNLKDDASMDLKGFLKSFLWTEPNLRLKASEALSSWYLEDSSERLDEPAREFWKAAAVIMPIIKPYGQFLGEGDMKSSLIDSEPPQSSKVLNPLLVAPRRCDGLRSGEESSTNGFHPSDGGRTSSKKCRLVETKKDSTTGTSDLPVPSIDPSPSLWNSEVSSDAREKMRENLAIIKEKFKLMKFPTNRGSSSSIENSRENEFTFIPTIKIETVNTPPSRSSNSSYGLEKLFIQNETPPQHHHTKSSSLKEQFSSPENNFPADQFYRGSLKSPNFSSKLRHEFKMQEAEKFAMPVPKSEFSRPVPKSESPDFSSQPGTRPDIKIPEAEKFLWPENNFPDDLKSQRSIGKAEKLPKIKIQGKFLLKEKSKDPKVPLSANPTFEDFQLACHTRTSEAVNGNPRFLRKDSPFPSPPPLGHPSHSKWPTSAEVKLKHHSRKLIDRRKLQSSQRKDRPTEKKPAVKTDATGTKPAVKPKATRAKTAVKTVKPVEKPAEMTAKPKAAGTKPEAKATNKHMRSKTKECLEVTAVQSDAIDVSLDTPLFTYGQPKAPLEREETKKKKGFFHLPCRKSRSGIKSTDKSSFSWF